MRLLNSTIDRLQSVIHAAALIIITGVCKYDHITPTVRDELHWLPVTQLYITFKLCPTVYKALHDMTPSYIAQFCSLVATTHYRSRVRSETCSDLVPRNRFELGKRAFAVSGPTTWNNLPLLHLP